MKFKKQSINNNINSNPKIIDEHIALPIVLNSLGTAVITIGNCIFNNLKTKTLLQIGDCQLSQYLSSQFNRNGCRQKYAIKVNAPTSNSSNRILDTMKNADILILSLKDEEEQLKMKECLTSYLNKYNHRRILIIDVCHNEIELNLPKINNTFYFHLKDLMAFFTVPTEAKSKLLV
ncbi:hypothetical protein [Alkalihalobacterium elongatum]|uniref:hypothetical protein n=1 Tax=Alkalihalobacterium elongatum TaxID=2675466 RepID=UPI001C1FC691|nr:hypothetical protein [Alkalihalobacterium elongatum]